MVIEATAIALLIVSVSSLTFASDRYSAVQKSFTRTTDLMDGRTITVPLTWYPRLLNATEQRAKWVLCGGGYGIHSEEIDEDLSTEGMLRGAPAPRAFVST